MYPLCCCGGCCNLRLYTPTPEIVWSKTAILKKSCYACVFDVAVDDDGDMFVLGSKTCNGVNTIVERWSAAGDKMWAVDVPDTANGFNVIAVDDDGIYVGGLDPTLLADSLFALDKADGSTLWSRHAGLYEINDLLVRNGIVYVATLASVETYDVATGNPGPIYEIGDYFPTGPFEPFPLVRVLSISIDDAGFLYTAGDAWEGGFCQARGTVAKFAPDRSLIWLWRGDRGFPANPDGVVNQSTHVEWAADHLFVVHRREVDSLYATLERWDPVTARFEWGRRVPAPENEFGVLSVPIIDMVADFDSVWAIADKSLWQWDHDGNLVSASPAAGTPFGLADEGDLKTIAGFPDGGVVAGGVRLKCEADDTEDKATEEAECGDLCEPVCGKVGPFGGTLVNCGWDEVWCEFETEVASTCELLNAKKIQWRRHEGIPTEWTGRLRFTCEEGPFLCREKTITFVVEYDCESEVNDGWSITATADCDVEVTDLVITETWCTDGAPPEWPFPGFRGKFSISGGGCESCVDACLGFGADGCGEETVDACLCEGIRTTLHATITNDADCACASGSAELTWVGGTQWVWIGSQAFGSCGSTISNITLDCNAPPMFGGDFLLQLGCNGNGVGILPAHSASCSPFELVYIVPSSNCCGGSFKVTITA